MDNLFSLLNLPKKQDREDLPTYLMVGLGNPGREYQNNRHNIGFMVLDHLAQRLGVNFSRVESKALVTKAIYQNTRVVLAKPQTYMNLSGQAVSSLVRFYKIPFENLVVAYDDVDLPFGVIRIRAQGGSAGQKGMRSIIEKLSTQEIPRLRLGIDRPPGKMDAAAYVLQDFSKAEREMLPAFLDRAVDALEIILNKGLVEAMNQYNA